MPFGVAPDDISDASVIALLGVVATLAAWIPARRAARIQPLVALRHE